MIAKRIVAPKQASSFARLARYVVKADGGLDPRSWTRTADYIVDLNARANSRGEKVGGVRVTNCATDDPAAATAQILATQARNRRSKGEKTYHLVFSFPPGEHPPLDVLHAIEDELCAAIGLADHQRISAVHVDTDHLHVHVAINKVHPTGFQNITPFQDMPRLMEACDRLEVAHGLTRTNHGIIKEKTNERGDRIELGPEPKRDTRFRAWLRQSYHLALAERPEAATYHDLRNLSGGGVARAPRRYSELLPGDARDRLQPVGGDGADRVRWARDGAGADAPGSLRPGPDGIEHHAGVESLISYVAREVAPAMRAAADWRSIHAALDEHGLVIRQRGAGLVIGDAELGLWCKASSAGRDLSERRLRERLGAFEPRVETAGVDADPAGPSGPDPGQPTAAWDTQSAEGPAGPGEEPGRKRHEPRAETAGVDTDSAGPSGPDPGPLTAARDTQSAKGPPDPGEEPVRKRYEPRPRQRTANSDALFAAYRREREAAILARRRQFAAIRADTAAQRAELTRWSQHQRSIIRATTKGTSRVIARGATNTQLADRKAAITRAAAARRAQLLGAQRLPTWNEWLTARAEAGDADALGLLRARVARDEALRGDLLAGDARGQQARVFVLKRAQGQVHKDGSVVYRTQDGGLVVDRQTHVHAQQTTTAATLVALEVAAGRFEGQKLDVRGTEAFRTEVARLAGVHRLNVRFADSGLDAMRESYGVMAEARTARPKAAQPGEAAVRAAAAVVMGRDPTGREDDAGGLEAWIAKRNRQAESILNIGPVRLWTSEDAGPALYQGRRRMQDGSEVLLLRRGGETLIKPSTANVVAKASRWKVGSTVRLDARGRFVARDQEVQL